MEGGGTQGHRTQTSDLARPTQPEANPTEARRGHRLEPDVFLVRPDVRQSPFASRALYTHTHT